MKVILINGQSADLTPNIWGQFRASDLVDLGLAEDECAACELLGAHPSSMRYGMVHADLPQTAGQDSFQ